MKRFWQRLGIGLLVVALVLLPMSGCKKAESDMDAASGEPRTTIRNLRILSTFRNEGTMTQAGASSLESYLHIAVPTAVATATPGVMVNVLGVSAPLEIRKASTPVFRVNGSGNLDMEGSLDVAGPAKLAIPTAQATATPGLFINSLAVSAPLEIQKASTKVFQVAGSGNVYILGTISASGAAALDAGITVDSPAFSVADTSGNVTTGGTLTVSGAAQLNGGLTMDTSAFTVANTSGNTQIAGTLGITGATTLVGALAANGGITVDSPAFSVADTTGAVQAGGLTVGVSGTGADVTFYSGTADDLLLWDASEECLDITGTASQNALRVLDGNVSFADDLAVTGATTLTGALGANGGITVDSTAFAVADTSGNTQIGGTLGVTGTTTLAGTLNADNGIAVDTDKFTVANSTGDTVVAGTFAANGGITVDTSNFTVSGTTGAVATASTATIGTFAIAGEAAAIEVTEGSTITPTGTYQPITSTGVVSTSLVTAIANGTTAGQLLIIVNENGADAITLVDQANIMAKANIVLGPADVAAFLWDGSIWICLFVRDNS